mmetsp:Transcript_35640/g.71416  ORF Transcript_35640/g.71416 Transcript_35640/m.71416 type:complete len:623 (+) Transcript_35640:26-1894(+)
MHTRARHLALVLLLTICGPASALLDLTGALGVATSVTANTETKLTFATLVGAELTVTTSSDADVTLSAVATPSSDLPPGHSSLSFAAGAGFTIEVSGDATMSATFKTPPLSATAQTLITGEVKAGCFRFDATAQSYTQVDIQSYNADQSITLSLPVEGTYFFVTLEAGLPVPTLYAEARATTANEFRVYSYPMGFLLGARTTSNNSITCTRSETSSTPPPTGQMAVGAYFDISMQTEETVEGQLNFTYDAAAMAAAAIAETSLKLMFKAEGEVWTEPDSVKVDTEAKVVFATTTHFSEWGIFGSASLGVARAVTANTATTVQYQDGTMLEITTDSNADVTLSAVVTATLTATTSLPSGVSALSLGAHGGFELMVEGGSATSTKITTPPLTAAAQALITGSVRAGCMKYDAQAESYTAVDIESYNADNTITVELPEPGTYVLVAIDASAAVNLPVVAVYGEARATVAGELKTLAFGSDVKVGVKTQTDNAITVTRTESDDSEPPEGLVGLGFVLDVDLQTEETVEGTIEVTYDAAAVAAKGIAEASLKLMFKAESGAWEEPDSGSVDTSAKVVVATTSHFSRWSVYGSADVDAGTPDAAAAAAPSTLLALTLLALLSLAAVRP